MDNIYITLDAFSIRWYALGRHYPHGPFMDAPAEFDAGFLDVSILDP